MNAITACAEQLSSDQPKAPILSNRYDYADGKIGYMIPDGYEFDFVRGVNRDEIILKPKKPTYPNTFAECCKIVNANPHVELVSYISNGQLYSYDVDILYLINNIRKLKICRDAYLKLADNWKPDWDNSSDKYCIMFIREDIRFKECQTKQCLLAFPTAEIRNVFYKNFKNLIKECKELL